VSATRLGERNVGSGELTCQSGALSVFSLDCVCEDTEDSHGTIWILLYTALFLSIGLSLISEVG
jgi:hypothetical protein